MRTTEDQTMAAGHSVDDVDPVRWQAGLDELLGRVARRFARADLRRRARAFVRGLLADLPRKNCWTIAEHAGDPNPDGMQHLLARALWDHDKVRDDLRDYVIDLWVPRTCAPHATWAYSWINPPRRSCRRTRTWAAGAGGGTAPNGGAWPRERCGRCPS